MIFKTAKTLINGIDLFLDTIMQGVPEFTDGLGNYLNHDENTFQLNLSKLKELEGRADDLRRDIEDKLYRHSLIPQHRGDVLALMENLDDIIDLLKEVMFLFDVERPDIPVIFHSGFINLAEKTSGSVKDIVSSTKIFFRDPLNVKAGLVKVYTFEKEADKLALNLKRSIYSNTGLDLSQKNHLRYFAFNIDSIADKAESVADMLSIYAIKQIV